MSERMPPRRLTLMSASYPRLELRGPLVRRNTPRRGALSNSFPSASGPLSAGEPLVVSRPSASTSISSKSKRRIVRNRPVTRVPVSHGLEHFLLAIISLTHTFGGGRTDPPACRYGVAGDRASASRTR